VEAKRNIDKYNQLRNNAIEKIDDWILSQLNSNTDIDLPMHSETPGMMIDRLSIMSLKKYHMLEETVRENASEEHRSNCSKKVSVLTEQIDDLSNCLKTILDKIVNGQLKFKVYRQFKMYNDPSLNPQLYKRTQS
jgi:ethanolamine ammonia-lyase large subunit